MSSITSLFHRSKRGSRQSPSDGIPDRRFSLRPKSLMQDSRLCGSESKATNNLEFHGADGLDESLRSQSRKFTLLRAKESSLVCCPLNTTVKRPNMSSFRITCSGQRKCCPGWLRWGGGREPPSTRDTSLRSRHDPLRKPGGWSPGSERTASDGTAGCLPPADSANWFRVGL